MTRLTLAHTGFPLTELTPTVADVAIDIPYSSVAEIVQDLPSIFFSSQSSFTSFHACLLRRLLSIFHTLIVEILRSFALFLWRSSISVLVEEFFDLCSRWEGHLRSLFWHGADHGKKRVEHTTLIKAVRNASSP